MLEVALSIVLGLLALVLLLYVIISSSIPSLRQYRMLSRIPGPPGHYFLGNAIEIAKVGSNGLLPWFLKQLECYPRMAKFWILGQPFIMLKEVEDAQVLLTSNVHITKGFEYNSLIPWLQEGLLLSTGDKWHTRRKMLTTPFHFKILEGSLGVFNKHCRMLCSKFLATKGAPVVVDDFTSLCTLDVICESAMGIQLGAQSEEAKEYVSQLKTTSELCNNRTRKGWLHREPLFKVSPDGRIFYKTLEKINTFTDKVIRDRKNAYYSESEDSLQTGKIKLAFLDTLLEIEKRLPGSLSLGDMREEVVTFTFEGQDTTSTALNFYFYLVGSHPEIQERIYAELKEVFEGDMDREVTLKDLQKMTYLESSLKESLRLYPSVPYLSRSLKSDLKLDGITIPAGTNVAVLPYHIHRNEKYWPEPEKFDPDRFSQAASKERNPFTYIPFSAGPRNCIGQKFAMMEMKMVACMVLRKLRVESVTKKEDFEACLHLTIRSSKPLVCKFIART